MKRLFVLIIASLLIVPTEAGAQGFLKGLKEKAEKRIEKAANSILGVEDKSQDEGQNSRAEFDAAQKEFQKRTEARAAQKETSGKRDNSELKGIVKPSTASAAQDLFNELPSIPTAAEVARDDEAVRNAFFTKIYAVRERVQQITEMGDSAEGMAILGASAKAYTPGASGSQQAAQEKAAELEGKMAGMMKGRSMEEFQAQAEADNAKLEKIQAEIEKLEAKKNPTAADKKRLEELNEEQMEIAMKYSGLFADASDAASSVSTEFGQSQADIEYTEFITKSAQLRADLEMGGDPALKKGRSALSGLRKSYNTLWTADGSQVAELYVQADEMLTNFKIDAAQARLDHYGKYLGQIRGMFDQAQKFAAAAEDGSIYGFSMKQSPYQIVGLYADVLERCFDALGDLSFEPVRKNRVALPLEAGDELVPSESRYVFMSKGDLGSVFGVPSDEDTLEDEFLSKATIVVNGRNGLAIISGGERRQMENDEDFSFIKEGKSAPAPSGEIQMKSLDKVVTLSAEGKLTLPDGTIYFPIAMQRTADWLSFIIEEPAKSNKIVLTKCMFRL